MCGHRDKQAFGGSVGGLQLFTGPYFASKECESLNGCDETAMISMTAIMSYKYLMCEPIADHLLANRRSGSDWTES